MHAVWSPMAIDACVSVVLVVNAFLAGSFVLSALLNREEYNSRLTILEWSFLALAVGFGIFAWIMLPAGVVLPYDRSLYRVAHAVLLIGGVWWWRSSRAARDIRSSWTPLERPSPVELAVWSSIALTLLYVAFLLLHGIGGSDGQTQHLYSVMAWEQAGRFVPMTSLADGLPYSMTSAQTLGGRLLYLQADLLGSIYAIGAFHVVTMAIACLGVVALGGVLFGQPVGRLAGLVFLTSPVLFRIFVSDVNDYFVHLLILLGVCTGLALAVKFGSRAWVRVTLMLAGVLCSVKYYSLMELAILTPIALVLLYRRNLLRGIGGAVALCVILASPWFVHQWIVYGDPIWPYLIGVFGGKAMTPSWHLYFDTYPYYLYGPYLSLPGTTFEAARRVYLFHELFPPVDSALSFSPLFVPAIAFWCVASWRDRRYLIPLLWTVGFLAMTLNSVLYNKYMFLVIAPAAPFIARPMWQFVATRPALRSLVHAVLGAFVLIVAWQFIIGTGLTTSLLTMRAEKAASEPIKTLNSLPPPARVFGNIMAMPLRYSRVNLTVSILNDSDELMCDDWRTLFDAYRRAGATHYLVDAAADQYPYDGILPMVDAHDPRLAETLRERRKVFERNRGLRDDYLKQHATLTDLAPYRLYTLDGPP